MRGFCYACNHSVAINHTSDGEPRCSECGSDFVELQSQSSPPRPAQQPPQPDTQAPPQQPRLRFHDMFTQMLESVISPRGAVIPPEVAARNMNRRPGAVPQTAPAPNAQPQPGASGANAFQPGATAGANASQARTAGGNVPGAAPPPAGMHPAGMWRIQTFGSDGHGRQFGGTFNTGADILRMMAQVHAPHGENADGDEMEAIEMESMGPFPMGPFMGFPFPMGPGGGGAQGSQVFGDYAVGNFQDVLDRLYAQGFGPTGAPPASEDAIHSLPRVAVTEEVAQKECVVCQDNFAAEGPEVVRLPCNHLFHLSCVEPWLKQHNSCPVCRDTQLPTSDSEHGHSHANVNSSSSTGGGQ